LARIVWGRDPFQAGLHAPDLPGVLGDSAVAREFTTTSNVVDHHLGPFFRVLLGWMGREGKLKPLQKEGILLCYVSVKNLITDWGIVKSQFIYRAFNKSRYTLQKRKKTRPPEWCSGLRHCIAMLEASLQTQVQSRAVSQLAVIRSPKGRRTTGPALSGLREGLAGEAILGSSRSSDSLWRAGHLQAVLGSSVEQRFLRHIGAAGFGVKRAGVKKHGLAGRVSEDA
jgi:hypothetical protein